MAQRRMAKRARPSDGQAPPDLLRLAALSSGSRAGLARVLHAAGAASSSRTAERQRSTAASSLRRERTPYGAVVREGPPFLFIDPRPLLWLLWTTSAAWRDFLTSVALRSPNRTLRVLFYADELRPGNVLRPDKARSLWSAAWGFLDALPSERSRCAFWLPFALLRTSQAHELGGPPAS